MSYMTLCLMCEETIKSIANRFSLPLVTMDWRSETGEFDFEDEEAFTIFQKSVISHLKQSSKFVATDMAIGLINSIYKVTPQSKVILHAFHLNKYLIGPGTFGIMCPSWVGDMILMS